MEFNLDAALSKYKQIIDQVDEWDVNITIHGVKYRAKRLSIADWQKYFLSSRYFNTESGIRELITDLLGQIACKSVSDPELEVVARSISTIYSSVVLPKKASLLNEIASDIRQQAEAQTTSA